MINTLIRWTKKCKEAENNKIHSYSSQFTLDISTVLQAVKKTQDL
jgi:hypothetical protein